MNTIYQKSWMVFFFHNYFNMVYFIKRIIFFLPCFIILSCTEQNDKPSSTTSNDHSTSIIKVDIQNDIIEQIDILSLVDTVITLETTGSNLIGKIGKIRQYHNDYYVFDVQRRVINVFDSTGRYKYVLGQTGKGPGELVIPGDFFMDWSANAIAVSDIRTGKVSFFNEKGEVVKEVSLEQKGVNYINGISNYKGIVWVINHEWQNNEYGLIVILAPKSNSVVNSFLSPTIDFYSATTNPMVLTYNGSEAYLSLAYDNEIYQLQQDGVQKKYQIDFGTYNITEEEKRQNKYKFLETLHRPDRAYGIINFNKFRDGKIYFAFDVGMEKYHFFYDQEKQQGIGIKELVLAGIPVKIWGYDQEFNLIANISAIPHLIQDSAREPESQKEANILNTIQGIDFARSNPVIVKLNSIEPIFYNK